MGKIENRWKLQFHSQTPIIIDGNMVLREIFALNTEEK